ncbi:MAG: PfkB family carbohydrate kinase, partial [Chloroflexota bacterium]
GDFILKYLEKKGVNTSLIPRKPGLSSLALLGVKPPSEFPLLFYRENPPDIWLNIDDIPDLSQAKAFLISGTALSRGSCADATFYAAEAARGAGCTTYLDLDLRPDQWTHTMAYGTTMRRIMPMVDVILGTEEELWAAINREPAGWHGNEAVTADERQAVEAWIEERMAETAVNQTIVLKRGKEGVTFFQSGQEPIDVSGFPVEVLNTVGAGDAFASGLIYSRTNGKSWAESGRFANACGAIVVTRHGCAEAMPTLADVEAFLENRN